MCTTTTGELEAVVDHTSSVVACKRLNKTKGEHDEFDIMKQVT